jgi:hypothetical protein
MLWLLGNDRNVYNIMQSTLIIFVSFGSLAGAYIPMCELNSKATALTRRLVLYGTRIPWGSTVRISYVLDNFLKEHIQLSLFAKSLKLGFSISGLDITYARLLQLLYILGGILMYILGQTQLIKQNLG